MKTYCIVLDVLDGNKEIEVRGESIEGAGDGVTGRIAFLVVKDANGNELARFAWSSIAGWYQGSHPATAEVPLS